MDDVEVVIKIPEVLYWAIKQNVSTDSVYDAVKYGTPLPKGHGDLIDRRELKKEVYTTTEWNGDVHRIIYEASIDDAKPIIEADRKEQE